MPPTPNYLKNIKNVKINFFKNMATSRLLCVRIEACADEVDLQVDLRWT